jgi:Rps23 Pro-64 3,4-dihydroxylase Tpa1-like proline 4-hydroxylase
MKFTIVKDPIPFLIIDDTYNKEEQIHIYNEIDFLASNLAIPSNNTSAVKDGMFKKNKNLFLDEYYQARDRSKILKINRKLFSPETIKELCQCHYAYNLIRNTNTDNTLLSYYDNGGSYFSHSDFSVITMVTWFFKEPKNFTGGEFIFSDYNLNIEVKNNRTVIFFGSYSHEVTEVLLINNSIPFSGRFTLSTFCKMI